ARSILERVPETELQLPLRVLRCDFSEVPVVRVNIQSAAGDATPVRVVEPIEHLEPEGNELFLGRVKIFEQPEVPVLESRLVEDVAAALIRESSLSRLQNINALSERVILAVSPELGRLRDVAVHNPARGKAVVRVTRISAACGP